MLKVGLLERLSSVANCHVRVSELAWEGLAERKDLLFILQERYSVDGLLSFDKLAMRMNESSVMLGNRYTSFDAMTLCNHAVDTFCEACQDVIRRGVLEAELAEKRAYFIRKGLSDSLSAWVVERGIEREQVLREHYLSLYDELVEGSRLGLARELQRFVEGLSETDYNLG